MREGRSDVPGGVPPGATSVMTRVVARLLLLPTLMAAVAILVKGYAEPGDGFSAGVVAALAILLQYLAFGREQVERLLPVKSPGNVAFAGLLLALGLAAFPLFMGEPPLTHYPPPGSKVIYLGTLEIITAVAFDVGIFLLVFGFATGAIRLVAHAMDHARTEEKGAP
ncbi:MAG: sodium:proton antiporter [Actinomycetota bacterium]|nr:sodium:proton antiporter [Actinomycetota bacterium]